MRLHAIHCRFGRLDGRYLLDPARLTLAVEENEQGKTTVLEAVLAALYGYERGGGWAERQRYLPLDGGPCFVQLELSAGGRRLSLRRDLGRDTADVVQVIDLERGGDLTAELAPSKGTQTVGERLLGLTREQFLKICVLRHGQAGQVSEAGSLSERIQSIVDTSVGERTAKEAIDALDLAMRHHEGWTLKTHGLISTEMARLNNQVLDARKEQAGLRALRDAIDEDARALDGLAAENAADEQRIRELTYLSDKAELLELEARHVERERQHSRSAELQAAMAGLEGDREALLDGEPRVEAVWKEVIGRRAAFESCYREIEQAEAERRQAQSQLERTGAVATWQTGERDEVVTAGGRLQSAMRVHEQADSSWREALRSAGPEARELFQGGSSPYADLSLSDRQALLAYPAELAQATLAIERLRRQIAQEQAAPSLG
ncbi:MAG: hypothetical protein ACR2PL_07925, partial [Dehalococcoidia bacterium]